MNEIESLTRELVSVASHEDETAAGDLIESWLREETVATVERDGVGNVLARRDLGDFDGSDSLSLAFVGHHDVVPPADEQVKGGEYVVEERDGRLYGRGTADMKGAVAAAMCAFRDAELAAENAELAAENAELAAGSAELAEESAELAEESAELAEESAELAAENAESPAGRDGPSLELVFASFVGEETGGHGARHAIDRGFVPDYAIVGEGSTGYSAPGITDVAVAHKGRREHIVIARGSAAHASEVDSGVNAIYRACDAVEVLRNLDAPVVEIAETGSVLRGSLAVTGIDGGSAANVIPDRCEITVDERTVPGEFAAIDRVESIAGVTHQLTDVLPPMRCNDESFAETVLSAATAAQGELSTPPELVVKPHATDAGWLSEAGTTCLVCGPSEPGEAHTATESVSIEVLERCYRIYRGAAERFAPDCS